MKKDKNQIICSVDRIKDNRVFEEIPFNRTIYDLILEKQQKNIKKQVKNNEKCDLVLNIGMIGSQSAMKMVSLYQMLTFIYQQSDWSILGK